MELLAFAISDRHINPFAAIIFYAPIVTLLLLLVINLTERISHRRLAARAAEWVRVRDAQSAALRFPEPDSFTLPGDFAAPLSPLPARCVEEIKAAQAREYGTKDARIAQLERQVVRSGERRAEYEEAAWALKEQVIELEKGMEGLRTKLWREWSETLKNP